MIREFRRRIDNRIYKWFMYGLKAQKLLAQGIALGIMVISKASCKGKSLINSPVL